jgi:hypothetical protein
MSKWFAGQSREKTYFEKHADSSLFPMVDMLLKLKQLTCRMPSKATESDI